MHLHPISIKRLGGLLDRVRRVVPFVQPLADETAEHRVQRGPGGHGSEGFLP